MVRCVNCRNVTEEDTKPCPNQPPCKSEDICGFPVVRCGHKTNAKRREKAIEQLRTAAESALWLLEGTAIAEDGDGHHNAAQNVREVERELFAALNELSLTQP